MTSYDGRLLASAGQAASAMPTCLAVTSVRRPGPSYRLEVGALPVMRDATPHRPVLGDAAPQGLTVRQRDGTIQSNSPVLCSPTIRHMARSSSRLHPSTLRRMTLS
jgi:hypothetical protein